MNGLTGEKIQVCGRIAGIIGLLCFPLLFMTARFFGFSENMSGVGVIMEWIGNSNRFDSEGCVLLQEIAMALAMGVVGVMTTFFKTGDLFSGVCHMEGMLFLIFLKASFESDSYGLAQMGIGWYLALIAYIIAALCALSTYFLRREA